MPANPTALSFYGIAKETTKGTFVPSADFLPLTKFDPVDKTVWLDDDGMRGSMAKVYDQIAGPVFSELSMSGPVFPDTIGYPLMGILGDVTVTGASAPFTHAGAIKNSTDGQPPAYSLNDFQVVENRGFPGVQFYDLNLKWDGEKLFTWDATAKGYQSAAQTKPAYSNSTIAALPGWLSTVTLNSISSLTLVDGEMKIKREGGPIHTADGTQAPYQMFVGAAEVSGKLVLVADTNTQLVNYLAGTKIPLDFNFTQGAGAALVQVKLHSTVTRINEVKTTRGKQWVEYEFDYTCLPNSTDAGASLGLSHLKATIQNAKPSGTYA